MSGPAHRVEEDHSMLSYVFWHWKRPEAAADDYERRQRAFHAALAQAPAEGFLSSFCSGVSGAPWVPASRDAYEDWYLVRDFTALGLLNEAAITESRRAPHDAAAALVAGGAAGLYGLRGGSPLAAPAHAYWFGKPEGVSYRELFAALEPSLAPGGAALWMRQMVLGPAREFCLHAMSPLSLPSTLEPLLLGLRTL
jgi:hypothetical protein